MSIDVESFEVTLRKVLNEEREITQGQHTADHEFVKMMREKAVKWDARWEKLQTSMIGGFALAILGGLGWIGKIVIDYVLQKGAP